MKNIIAEEIDRRVEDKVKLAKKHGWEMSNFLDNLMNNETYMSAEDLDIAEYSFKLAKLELKDRLARKRAEEEAKPEKENTNIKLKIKILNIFFIIHTFFFKIFINYFI